MSIDTRVENVVKRGKMDIVDRIPHSSMIKNNKCSEFRYIFMCQIGVERENELLDLRYEYLPMLYYETTDMEQCVCSQHITKIHFIKEIGSNEIFKCGGDCLKHLSDDLYRRAKQYERQYKKKLEEYNTMKNKYYDFLTNFVISKKNGMTIRDLISESRFESSTKTIIWYKDNYNCSYPEIGLFIDYLYETDFEDINLEQFLLSMKMPNYEKCNCGYYTKPNYSEKHNRTIAGCGNIKKTPTGWEKGCKFFKYGFLDTKEFGENPLLILAEQVAVNNKRLQKLCKGIRFLPK